MSEANKSPELKTLNKTLEWAKNFRKKADSFIRQHPSLLMIPALTTSIALGMDGLHTDPDNLYLLGTQSLNSLTILGIAASTVDLKIDLRQK